MSVGSVLTVLFDVIWLLAVLGLIAFMAWQVSLILHDIRDIKALLKQTTVVSAESSHAIALLAAAISQASGHIEAFLAAQTPAKAVDKAVATKATTKLKAPARTPASK